uniref:Subtilisin inhibitor domain-containing protein n=1 Tax=Entomoneis paludosa TaxID=265537 RepID=A0A7S2YCC1_9STRA|mmetsp:Transcript_27046/g.56637  ORF Transcript_27046/g.56637 Transcript_27046/m.56637 type:complete len:205 (+) Transcript_27046:119-733(+)
MSSSTSSSVSLESIINQEEEDCTKVVPSSHPSTNDRPNNNKNKKSLWLWLALTLSLLVASIILGVSLIWVHHQQSTTSDTKPVLDETTTITPTGPFRTSSTTPATTAAILQEQEESHLATTQPPLLTLAPPSNTLMTPSNKTSWPELVGQPGAQAKAIIQQENPHMTTVVMVPEHSMVTMDYREDRVRIFVKEDGTVAMTPNMG